MAKRYRTLAAYLAATGERQEDFAARVGTTQPTISRIVTGRERPGTDLALRIAKVTRVPLENLLSPRDEVA